MSLGQRIKEFRMLVKLSQVALGKRAGGIPSATISRYENDLIESPKIQHLLAISAALGANPQYIIEGTLPKMLKDLSGGIKELTDACVGLSPDAIAMLVTAAKSLHK